MPPDLQIPSSIMNLINSIQVQNNIWMSLSGAAVALVLLTWFRVSGLIQDVNLNFNWPYFLVLPLLLFVCAFIFSYWINTTLTSYFVEIAKGINVSCDAADAAITDAKKHFLDEYFPVLKCQALGQLCCNALGVIALSGWFVANLIRRRGGNECQRS